MNKHYFESNDVDELYKQLIKSISEEPQYSVAPRGMQIKETIGVVAKLTEEQVSALASGLYAVFSDNPNFLEWLNERPAKRSKQRNPRTT